MWFTGVAVLTYTYKDEAEIGTFSAAGNGFFGTWAAFFISFILFYTSWAGDGKEPAHQTLKRVEIS